MKSMTGYGRATAELAGFSLTVQVNSVNRKTLDLTVKMPEEWDSLEPLVGEWVRKFASRGKVHVDIELTGSKSATQATWDEEAASEALDRVAAFAARKGVPFQPTPELLWQVANSQRRESELPAAEAAQASLTATLTTALRSFSAMRAKEGESLMIDFIKRSELLHRQVDVVMARAPLVPANYREQLMKRLRDAGLELDLNDERVLREIALFADRCDVTEEITRLRSHFEQFAALLKSEGKSDARRSSFCRKLVVR